MSQTQIGSGRDAIRLNTWSRVASAIALNTETARACDAVSGTVFDRPSDGQQPVTVSKLELRIPVVDKPGGVVRYPAPKVVPYGSKLAADFRRDRRGPHRHRFTYGW